MASQVEVQTYRQPHRDQSPWRDRSSQGGFSSPPGWEPVTPANRFSDVAPQHKTVAQDASKSQSSRTPNNQRPDHAAPSPDRRTRTSLGEDPFKTPPSSRHASSTSNQVKVPVTEQEKWSDDLRAQALAQQEADDEADYRRRQRQPADERRNQPDGNRSVPRMTETEKAEHAEEESRRRRDMALRQERQRQEYEYARAELAQKEKEKEKEKKLSHRLSHRNLKKSQSPDLQEHDGSPRQLFGFLSRFKSKPTPPVSSRIEEEKIIPTRAEKEVQPLGIEPGGRGIVPGIDAPKSAVNAGERRVTIRCDGSSINLPVTPETTPVDLIFSAANILSQDINPKTSILLESYVKAGLERPIRRYEHVRDIMNSWDRDAANALLLVPSTTAGQDEALDAVFVPKEQPEDISVHINYSQQPGKWKKQHVTLRSDGQMLLTKKAGASDSTNVCHLSDFDIYKPTPTQLKKVVKPGKKHCFAVKSQQKSAIFATQSTFVHFFATDDKRLAARWYDAVQKWRSWYLVNRLGEGQKRRNVSPRKGADLAATVGRTGRIHNNGADSHESNPYQIGSFQPFLKTEELTKATANPSQEGTSPSAAARGPHHSRRSSSKRHSPPPASFPRKLTRDRHGSGGSSGTLQPSGSTKSSEDGDATFAPAGLLGETYVQRRAALDNSSPQKAGAFTEGTTLIAGGGRVHDDRTNLGRAGTVRTSGGGLHHRPSQREKPKPLLDLTPQYREPPQHQRKGRGHKPANGTTALVEAATTPEDVMGIPPATTWRRSNTTARAAPGRLAAARRSQQAAQTPHLNPFTDLAHQEEDEEGFRGLLAKQAKTGQGAVTQGRGVMTGNRHAAKPMLDLSQDGDFAKGSLLQQVDRMEDKGPVIDRQKRREEETKTGEDMW